MKSRGFQNVIPPAVLERTAGSVRPLGYLPWYPWRSRCDTITPIKRPRRRGNAFPLDKASPRGIMKIQKGAVDLTVGPNDWSN